MADVDLQSDRFGEEEMDYVLEFLRLKKPKALTASQESIKSVPNGDCSIVAVSELSGAKYSVVEQYASDNYGYKGRGLSLADTIYLAKHFGLVKAIEGVFNRLPECKGLTAREAASVLGKGLYLVFTAKHVMPCKNGQLSNVNGHGDEQITAIATCRKPIQKHKSSASYNSARTVGSPANLAQAAKQKISHRALMQTMTRTRVTAALLAVADLLSQEVES